MLFLLANWRWLLPTIIALGLGVALGVTKYELNSLHLAIAEQQTQAQKLISDKNAAIVLEVQARAALNRQLESDHAQAEKDIAAAHDDYGRALALKLRSPSRISCPAPGGPKAVDPAAGEAVASAGLFLPTATLQALGTLMQSADELVATMKQCKAFADSVGR